MGEEAKREKLWTKSFIVLTCVNFVSALTFYLLMVKMTEYAYTTYNVSQSVAGGALSSYIIGALLTRLFLGGRIDEWGARKSLFLGFAVNAVMAFLYIIPMGIVPLYIVRFLHGFGFALSSGAAASAAVMILPAARRGEGIGYFSMAQALATGVGPFVAIVITNAFNSYTVLFAITGCGCVLAFLSLFLLKLPPAANGRPRDKSAPKQKITLATFIQFSVIPLAGTLLLAYLGYAGVLSFMTLYTSEIGLTNAASFFFVVYALVILFSRPFTGRYVDRKGPNRIVYCALVSLVIGLVLMWSAASVTSSFGAVAGSAVLLIAAAGIGFGVGNTQSVVQAVIAKITPENELGKANSTFFMSMDLGSGVGPVLIGLVIPFTGYAGSYLLLAVIAVIAIAYYFFSFARKVTVEGSES